MNLNLLIALLSLDKDTKEEARSDLEKLFAYQDEFFKIYIE